MSFKSTGPKTRPERMKPPTSTTTATPTSPSTSTPPVPPSWSASRRRSSTSTTSTHDAENDTFHDAHFPPAEEKRMLDSSNSLKTSANAQFNNADYSSAISTYDRALAELPSYLEYELAVLQSNIAACHVKLEQWKEAIDACESGLAGLERLSPTTKKGKGEGKGREKGKRKSKSKSKTTNGTISSSSSNSDVDDIATTDLNPSTNDDTVIELPSSSSETSLHAHLAALEISDAHKSNIRRIRTKLLLRRARARSSITPSTWTHVAGALEDYRTLSSPELFSMLPPSDQRTVRQGLTDLPGRVSEAKDKEVGEMMGKLKELGNGILKPFGLSTDMFKMNQDEKGGWSVGFDQGGGGKEGGGEGERG